MYHRSCRIYVKFSGNTALSYTNDSISSSKFGVTEYNSLGFSSLELGFIEASNPQTTALSHP